jgi:hypothetical protein
LNGLQSEPAPNDAVAQHSKQDNFLFDPWAGVKQDFGVPPKTFPSMRDSPFATRRASPLHTTKHRLGALKTSGVGLSDEEGFVAAAGFADEHGDGWKAIGGAGRLRRLLSPRRGHQTEGHADMMPAACFISTSQVL